MDYNHYRPHSSLGYMTPAGFAEQRRQTGCIRPHTPVFDGARTVESSHRDWTQKGGRSSCRLAIESNVEIETWN
jgi:hypothetical protein